MPTIRKFRVRPGGQLTVGGVSYHAGDLLDELPPGLLSLGSLEPVDVDSAGRVVAHYESPAPALPRAEQTPSAPARPAPTPKAIADRARQIQAEFAGQRLHVPHVPLDVAVRLAIQKMGMPVAETLTGPTAEKLIALAQERQNQDVADAARVYIAQMREIGRLVSVAEAVTHVRTERGL